LLFFGRIHPDKGAADAICVSRAAGRPLILAGIVQDQDYFRREVEPHLSADALGLLHLIHFAEPFGLSVVEAMACGTPVVAYPRGSMAELVKHGVSGFLVDDEDGAVAAAGQLGNLDRTAVRACAERFSVSRMVGRYLAAYHAVLSQQQPARSEVSDA